MKFTIVIVPIVASLTLCLKRQIYLLNQIRPSYAIDEYHTYVASYRFGSTVKIVPLKYVR